MFGCRIALVGHHDVDNAHIVTGLHRRLTVVQIAGDDVVAARVVPRDPKYVGAEVGQHPATPTGRLAPPSLQHHYVLQHRVLFQPRERSRSRRILPVSVRGSVSTKSTIRGAAWRPSFERTMWRTSSPTCSAGTVPLSTITARTTDPRSGAGAATTAASSTPRWSNSRSSTSDGLTLYPDVTMRSSSRPVNQ